MGSQLYPKTREKFLTAQLSWIVGTYRALLLPESYIPDFEDEFLSDIIEGTRIAISEEIADKTATNGYANCAPISFPLLTDSRNVAKVVIYKDTGNEATSALILFLDT